jgi:antitoxin ParD1/3/4
MAIRKTMNVSLAPELERFVAETVASGRYRSASEVVRAALRLLEKEEKGRLQPDSDLHRAKEGDHAK